MFTYLTIIIASGISLVGIFLKTKEDSKSSTFYKLTKGGWILVVLALSLLTISILIQFQKDKIQNLQEIAQSRKRSIDSLNQISQRQKIELLLNNQMEKSKTDSQNLTNQIHLLDSIRKSQNLTLTEQRSNNSYLLRQLQESEIRSNLINFPIDTLYLSAAIEIHLNDSSALAIQKAFLDYIPVEKRLSGSNAILIDNSFPFIYKYFPDLYLMMKNLKLIIQKNWHQNSNYFYAKFTYNLNEYIDTVNLYNNPPLTLCATETQDSPFYSYLTILSSHRLVLTIHLITPAQVDPIYYKTSLKDFCDTDLEMVVLSKNIEDKKYIKFIESPCLTLVNNKKERIWSQTNSFKMISEGKLSDFIWQRVYSFKSRCNFY
ncbi:MAG: hypothetical protein BGO53_13025 [Sphingobacteriales bacterium 39-19]|nr:hypothetical protein [Sphingobacteriales bacterium]OJW08819.1 MAG: hypothetical protein BGO53_13025 [Sphingobacteriales bacterium 39-19]